MAFYLKYRPQSLDQLLGQETVKKILSASFANNKLSHAYLFVGPRGTGKTSTARILAKMVNCEKSTVYSLQSTEIAEVGSRKSVDDNNIPCNQCPTCLSITDGSNLDLIEIDAASNRGIDDIRELREKIKLSPTSAKKKVYIIDEVHMLTTEAFNALLKTLEEPPKHALFILATTDVQKVPQTILSRVQRLDFRLASTKELLESFVKIIKEERIDIEDEALKLLAKKAEGSFRDGIKLLDQVSSIEEKVTLKLLEETLKSGQPDEIFKLLMSFSKKDPKSSLLILHKILENGVDARAFTLSLMDVLRNIVLVKNGLGESLVEPAYSEENYAQLKNLTNNFLSQDLIKILNLLQESLEKLKFASIAVLPLELAIVEICNTQSVILNEAKRSEGSLTNVSLNDSNELRDSSPAKPVQNDNKEMPIVIPAITGIQLNKEVGDDISKLKEKWNFVLETIRPYNFSLEALLRSVNIAECSETNIIMEVPYSFHQRILEAPKNREILESIISDILGRSIQVATVLGNRPKRGDDIVNIEVAADDEIIRVAAEIFSSETIN